jgi:hypothetical protein
MVRGLANDSRANAALFAAENKFAQNKKSVG